MTIIIGSIGNEINFIRDYWRKTKHESESLIRYYKQIDQPTSVKDIQTKKIIPFDNYFGGYSNHLNEPFVYWNGFYIQPFKVQSLNELINEQKLFYNGKFVNDINEIKEYIFAYKKGFESGCKHFDNVEIENKSSVFKSDNLSIEKITNFVEYNNNIAKTGFTFTSFFKGNLKEYCPFRNNYKETTGLPSCECSIMPEYPKGGEAPCFYCPLYTLPELKKWEQKGFKNGKYYRAWFIILSNFKIFDEYFKNIQTPQPTGKPQPIKTKAENLKEYLSQYGFFELEKVKSLSEQSKALLIEKISESGLPYAIAMFDYLQFIQHLEKKHFDRKYKLNREVSKWFDSGKEGRAVKGNISSLLKNTTENKARYTAYKHKENAEKYYKSLK